MSLFQSILGGGAGESTGTLFETGNPFRRVKPEQTSPANVQAQAAVTSVQDSLPVSADVDRTADRRKKKKRERPGGATSQCIVAVARRTQYVPKLKRLCRSVGGLEAVRGVGKPIKREQKVSITAVEEEEEIRQAVPIKAEHKPPRGAQEPRKLRKSTEDTKQSQDKADELGKRLKRKGKRKGPPEEGDAEVPAEGSSVDATVQRGVQKPRKKVKESNVKVKIEAHERKDVDSNEKGQAEGTEATVNTKARRTPEEEAELLSRTAFLGNLPSDIKKRRLKAIFSAYGKIVSIRMRSIPIQLDKKMPRRAAVLGKHVSEDRGTAKAYIVFEDVASVTAALQHNMQEVDGLHIRVDKASKPSKDAKDSGGQFDRSRSIFIGNLAFNVEDEEIIRLFNDDADDADAVAGVRVVRDAETNIGKGFGFVLFNSKNGARMALARDGTALKGRPIRVTRVAVVGRGEASKKGKNGAVSRLGRLNSKPGQGKAERKFGAVPSKRGADPITSWQGVRTKGVGKFKKSSAAAAPKQRKAAAAWGSSEQQSAEQSAVEGRIRATKRPAVAARKAKALGLPLPKQPTKKQKERRAKTMKYRQPL